MKSLLYSSLAEKNVGICKHFLSRELSLKQAHTSLISLAAELSMNKLEAALIPTFFFFLFVRLFVLEDPRQTSLQEPL